MFISELLFKSQSEFRFSDLCAFMHTITIEKFGISKISVKRNEYSFSARTHSFDEK